MFLPKVEYPRMSIFNKLSDYIKKHSSWIKILLSVWTSYGNSLYA